MTTEEKKDVTINEAEKNDVQDQAEQEGEKMEEEKVAVKILFKTIKVKPKWVKPIEVTKTVVKTVGGAAIIVGTGYFGYKMGVKHIGALKDVEIGNLKRTINEIKKIELPKQELIEAVDTAKEVVGDVVETVVEEAAETV